MDRRFKMEGYQKILSRNDFNLKRMEIDRFIPETTFAIVHAVCYHWMIRFFRDIAREQDRSVKLVTLGCVPCVCEQIAKAHLNDPVEIHGVGLGTDEIDKDEISWFNSIHEFDIEGHQLFQNNLVGTFQ